MDNINFGYNETSSGYIELQSDSKVSLGVDIFYTHSSRMLRDFSKKISELDRKLIDTVRFDNLLGLDIIPFDIRGQT